MASHFAADLAKKQGCLKNDFQGGMAKKLGSGAEQVISGCHSERSEESLFL
jgi:hypothetical protein